MSSEWVYLISDGSHLVKVGRTTQPAKRLAALITQSARVGLKIIHSVECGGFAGKVEARTMKSLAQHRLIGEWFAVNPTVAVDALAEAAAFVHEAVNRYRRHRDYLAEAIARNPLPKVGRVVSAASVGAEHPWPRPVTRSPDVF